MCVGDREAVYEARKAARDLKNVMFHPGEANDLPFDDGYLTQVVSLSGTWDAPEPIAREIARVLAGGGFVHVATENSEVFRTAGWREEPPSKGLRRVLQARRTKTEIPAGAASRAALGDAANGPPGLIHSEVSRLREVPSGITFR